MYNELKSLLPKQNGKIEYTSFLEVFPSLELLKTTPQDSYYHAEGDVWTHTKMVCDSLVGSSKYWSSSEDEQFIMFYSCLLHDISKPACTKHEEGRITSKGHSKRGAIDTRIDLWKKEIPFYLRESIVNIINCHQVPFFAFNQIQKGNHQIRTPEFLAHQLSWQMPLHLLINVAKADMLGRTYVGKQQSMDDINLFEELCLEENCLYQPKKFFNEQTRMKYFSSNGSISPDYEFYTEPGSEVIVMCALPASGKNTWIQKHGNNLPTISFDDTKAEYGLKENDNVGKAVHDTIDRAKELLRKKEPFIWNSTNINPQMRKKTLDLLYSYGATVKIVYLESAEKEIKNRNTKRDTTLSNKKIDEMLFKWDVPTSIEAHSVSYEINNTYKKNLKFNTQ